MVSCIVVSQQSPYVQSTLHNQNFKRGGHSLSSVHAFKYLYILHSLILLHTSSYTLTHTHTHTHTHPHTHILTHISTQMTTASVVVQTRVVVTMPTRNPLFLFTKESITTSDREECFHWCWRYVYNTWWCNHDVTIDNDVLVLSPDPTHRMTQLSFFGLAPNLKGIFSLYTLQSYSISLRGFGYQFSLWVGVHGQ